MNFIQALMAQSRSTEIIVAGVSQPLWAGRVSRIAMLVLGCACFASATANAQQSQSVSLAPATQSASFRSMLKDDRISTHAAQTVSHQLTDQPSASDSAQTDPQQRAAERLQSRFAALEKPVREIRVVQADVAGSFPENHAAELLAPMAAHVIESDWHEIPTYDRYPVCFFHQPLHFEERNLERCGNGHGYLTNAVSTFWFLSNTAVWPYRMASEPHCQCVNSAGDCKTCQRYALPIEPLHTDSTRHELAKGVLAEAAVIAGFTFLVL